jgi:D-lactate dehydrogenase
MKPKIAFFDVHQLDQATYKTGLSDQFEVVFEENQFTPDSFSVANDATVISVHVTSKVTAELMAKLPQLKHIACRTTGFDNVDLEYAGAHDISVSYVPAYGQDTVAEYAFLLMQAVSRKLIVATRAVVAGEVVPEQLTGHELVGKTLGVIGTGRIGQRAASIGRGYGMNVIGFDPYPNEAAAKEHGFTYATLADLVSSADFITLHAPATPDNNHLLGAAQFAQMKKGVFLVNTARGSLVDTPALIDAVESGIVAGAGLDVLEGEEYLELVPELHLLGTEKLTDEARQVLSIDILQKLPNVIITSHNAYNSAEALERIRQTTISNILAWHTGKPENEVKHK